MSAAFPSRDPLARVAFALLTGRGVMPPPRVGASERPEAGLRGVLAELAARFLASYGAGLTTVVVRGGVRLVQRPLDALLEETGLRCSLTFVDVLERAWIARDVTDLSPLLGGELNVVDQLLLCMVQESGRVTECVVGQRNVARVCALGELLAADEPRPQPAPTWPDDPISRRGQVELLSALRVRIARELVDSEDRLRASAQWRSDAARRADLLDRCLDFVFAEQAFDVLMPVGYLIRHIHDSTIEPIVVAANAAAGQGGTDAERLSIRAAYAVPYRPLVRVIDAWEHARTARPTDPDYGANVVLRSALAITPAHAESVRRLLGELEGVIGAR